MIKYVNSFKIFIFSIIAVQIALYFFGYLRPSIIYDYIDYFPFTILPAVIYFYLNIKRITNRVYFYLSMYLSVVLLLFPIAQTFDAKFLTTYSFPSFLENRELNRDSEYLLVIDTDGSINLNTFNEAGYTADIIDKPGKIGYPEAVETLVGEPKAVLFREIQTSSLLKVAGWNINIGNKNIWKLNLLSFDSDLHLDNINLKDSRIAGTGAIYLGKDLNLEELKVNGNFDIKVSNTLPIVVVGNADVPPTWINATIGYLNQAEKVYKLKVVVEDGSEVRFINED
ncbi:MAG: hypothetical protein O2808_02235 [Actinomycetota bacterium]|nr:hypothetical protein [Actinomycetota bacterium]MDA3008620.1 hypothetical protein [Actinomycetota bacterium]MDA3036785.1 hypothetical protein [Actinomycetota bacterium]